MYDNNNNNNNNMYQHAFCKFIKYKNMYCIRKQQ